MLQRNSRCNETTAVDVLMIAAPNLIGHALLRLLRLQALTADTYQDYSSDWDKQYSFPVLILNPNGTDMEMNQTSSRIHPLVAGAAVSVMLVSIVGAAAIVGIIPASQGSAPKDTAITSQPIAAPAAISSPSPALATNAVAVAPQPVAPPAVKEVVRHKTVVHHKYVQHTAPAASQPSYSQVSQVSAAPVAQPSTSGVYSPAPVYQQPAPVAQNSPVGIGVGAVVGGLLGNQIGKGSGRTLATVAGVIGGGYVGNEIARRSAQP
ncbi:glycine zipper 2TM domain-containing protein [Noviherbaspirillum sp. Root189]|uniref:glycine zipper 2TM domain-containing protein n=1 Tax=Noviherbaspirillum sp. Root189 TaxID=1736487 RepID=UPI000710AA1F|nr:glycine zipper 2TM domain-containing protein [Noviherbaspirillum sp. Root189]KRB78280.1 hypothetical protein ASE07_26065 [Noviherbaspirillum sp. Root189]